MAFMKRIVLFMATGAALFATLLLGRWLVTSRFGRVLTAIRDAVRRDTSDAGAWLAMSRIALARSNAALASS